MYYYLLVVFWVIKNQLLYILLFIIENMQRFMSLTHTFINYTYI